VLFTIAKYIPEGLYGFLLSSEGERVFFHLSEFDPKGGPPPLIGEDVDVERLEPNGDKNPRARCVVRLHPPIPFTGAVLRFDPNVGYGFVKVAGRQFFLHRSELQSGELPRVGMTVSFYASPETVPGKPSRACYVQLVDRGGEK